MAAIEPVKASVQTRHSLAYLRIESSTSDNTQMTADGSLLTGRVTPARPLRVHLATAGTPCQGLPRYPK
jgi:hypothetical protein